MKLKFNTNIIEAIVPDTYGSDFQYEVSDEMWEDFKQLMIDKAEEVLKEILAETDFKDATLTMGEFKSPDYYNYRTDWIEFDLEFEDSLLERIKSDADNKFFEWAKDRYHSYDGFISFMPYEREEFFTAIDFPPESYLYKKELAIAMWINYQIWQNFDTEELERDYLYHVWEYARDNGYMIEEEEDKCV